MQALECKRFPALDEAHDYALLDLARSRSCVGRRSGELVELVNLELGAAEYAEMVEVEHDKLLATGAGACEWVKLDEVLREEEDEAVGLGDVDLVNALAVVLAGAVVGDGEEALYSRLGVSLQSGIVSSGA